jgi:hypothetical protein
MSSSENHNIKTRQIFNLFLCKIYDEDKGCNENILLSYGTNPNRTNQKVDLEQLGFLENLQEQNRASFVNTKLIVELYNKFKKYPDVICAYNMIEKINEQISNENISLDEYDKLVDKLHRAQLQFMDIIINYNIKKMSFTETFEDPAMIKNMIVEIRKFADLKEYQEIKKIDRLQF